MRLLVTLMFACVLLVAPNADAKGGGHGGGHGSGHGSGGHASSGGHSGHRAAGHEGSAARAKPPTARGRTRIGQPASGTAVPRLPIPPPTLPSVPGAPALLPAHPLFIFSGFGFSSFGWPTVDPLDVTGPTGGLRLKIEPADAQVFVDGFYAGVVADFSGRFHHLNLSPGPHHLEIGAPDYQAIAIDVIVQAHQTREFQTSLVRVR